MSSILYTSPDDVEAAFYDAMGRADLNAMMTIWSEDEEFVCIHPGSIRLVGLGAIRESWRQLFASGMRLHVRPTHLIRWHNLMTAVHTVHQRVHVEGDDRLHPPIIATNVYTRGASGWRMVMHHTSSSPDVDNLQGHDGPHVVH